jgi:hypothetical protein
MAAKMLFKKHQQRIKKAKANILEKARGKKLKREEQEKAKNARTCSC